MACRISSMGDLLGHHGEPSCCGNAATARDSVPARLNGVQPRECGSGALPATDPSVLRGVLVGDERRADDTVYGHGGFCNWQLLP
jgi:hypothetical protein